MRRRGVLRLLGAATLAFAALVAPAIARADTRTATVTLANPLVTPVPNYQTGFGVYNFTVSNVKKGAVADASFPFTAGVKAGHCVELDQAVGNSAVVLRTGADLSGNVAANPGKVQWLLESSRRNSPGNALQAAAHQSAIWQITDPVPAALLASPTGQAVATQLVSNANLHAADATKGASVDIVGGAGATSCAGTSRTVIVTGTPFTTSTLTITSGSAVFASNGLKTAGVAIGADGTGTAVINSDVNSPGAVTISASIILSTMVQSDGGGKQDFAYLVDQTVVRTVTVTFTDCRLAISKTAEPKFNRSFTWTVTKVVTSAPKVTVDGGATATFTYAVAATKSAAVDTGWTVSGKVTIQNPGPATTATVADAIPGTTCAVNGTAGSASVNLAAATATAVGYVCTYAAKPTYNVAQTNTATVTWQQQGSGTITQNTTAPFTFNDGTAGNPAVTGDSATVTDVFNGGTPVPLGVVTRTTTFPTSTTFTVPASQTGCVDLPNSATVTSTGTPATATSTVTVCKTTPPAPPAPAVTTQVTPPVTPAGAPSKTTISLEKTAGVAVVKPGNTVRFTIGWKNTGKAAAKNVVICDKLPSGLTFSSAAGATFKGGKACWSRKSVKVGHRLSFVVIARVDADAGSRSFTNVATATASNAPSRTANAKVRSLPQKTRKPGGVTG
jgi:uncharacterized repeat protein (TIGR01451 family)